MPNLGNARRYTGPNGANNFITDNPEIELIRDINNRIIAIELTTKYNVLLTKTITRDGVGRVTDVSRWVR